MTDFPEPHDLLIITIPITRTGILAEAATRLQDFAGAFDMEILHRHPDCAPCQPNTITEESL